MQKESKGLEFWDGVMLILILIKMMQEGIEIHWYYFLLIPVFSGLHYLLKLKVIALVYVWNLKYISWKARRKANKIYQGKK